MKGKKKYIVPLLVASVTASGAVVSSIQNVQQQSQVFAEAVASDVKLTSENVQITNFDKEVTLGEKFNLPTVIVANEGVKITYTVKKGKTTVTKHEVTTAASHLNSGKYVVTPDVEVDADLAGYYTIKITAEVDGKISTLAESLQVYVDTPTVTISLVNNSKYVIPAKVATNQSNFYIPMPKLSMNGEALTDAEVRDEFEDGNFRVILTNPEGVQYDLTIDTNNDYFYVAPEKLAVAGNYDISYYYEDGVAKASLEGLQEFQAIADYDYSKIDLDFSLIGTFPTTGEVGKPVSLSQLKIYDAKSGTTNTVNAQTVIKVVHEKTGTEYPVNYEDFTFTPEQTGNYVVSYQAKMDIFGLSTTEGTKNPAPIVVSDKSTNVARMTYAYTTDTSTSSNTYGLVNGIYSGTTGTDKNALDGRYLEPVTYDVTSAGVIKSVTYRGETHNVDYTYASDNTTITHVNGIKFTNNDVFKLLMNRAVQDIVDEFFVTLDPEVVSVAQLQKDASGNTSVDVVIPAIYGADNYKLYNQVTYTRKLVNPSGTSLRLVKTPASGTQQEVLYKDNETAKYTITTAGEYELTYTMYDGVNTKTLSHTIMVYDADSDTDLKEYTLKDTDGHDVNGTFGKLGDGVTTINSNINTKSVSSEGTLIFRKPTASDTYDEYLDIKTYFNVVYDGVEGTRIEVSEDLDYVSYNEKSGEYSIDIAKALDVATTADSKVLADVKNVRITVEATADDSLTGTRISGVYTNGQVAVFDGDNHYTYYTKEIAVRNTSDAIPVEFGAINFNTALVSAVNTEESINNASIISDAMEANGISGATDINEYGFLSSNTNYAPFNQNSKVDIALPTVTFTDTDSNLRIKVLVSNTNDTTGNVSNLSLEKQYISNVTESGGVYTYTLSGATVNLAHSGVYTITYVAEDIGGNITMQSYGFRVNDMTNPTIIIANSTEFDEKWEAGKLFTVPEATLQKYGTAFDDGTWVTGWNIQPASKDAEFDLEVNNGFIPYTAGTYYVNYYATNGTTIINLDGVYALTVEDSLKPEITVDTTCPLDSKREWSGSSQLIYFPIATAVDPNFAGELDVTYTVTNANNTKITDTAVDGDYIKYDDYYKITNNAITVDGKNITLDGTETKYEMDYHNAVTYKSQAYVEVGGEYYMVKTKVVSGSTQEYYVNGSNTEVVLTTETKVYQRFTESASGEYVKYTTVEQLVNDDDKWTVVDAYGINQEVDVDDYVRYVKVRNTGTDKDYIKASLVRSFKADKQSTYTITYTATDGTNKATVTKVIKVGDVDKPELAWTDSSKLITTIEKGKTWSLPVHYITLSDKVSSSDYLWDKLTVTLTAPDNTRVSNLGDESENEYKWKFDQTGDYSLQITVRDEAGNVNSSYVYKINVPADKAEEEKITPIVGTILIVLSVLVLAGVVTYFVVSNLRKGKKKSKKASKKVESTETTEE